jgi:hypothetical protein
MRILMKMIALSAALMMASCEDPVDDLPLRGAQGGLSALQWGDGPEEVRRRMLEMPEVRLIIDTAEIHAFAAWITPDTVEAPANIARYRRMEFRGGTFLGYPVEWWSMTLDDATDLRQVRIDLAPLDDAGQARWKIRRQLHRIYDMSDAPEFDPDRFLADDWSTPARSASTARTAIGIGKYGSTITIGFVDRAWADERWPSRYEQQRRRMHVNEWRRYLAAVAKERGWKMEDLPPQ